MDEKAISVRQIGNEIEIRRGDEARRLPLSFLDGMAADIGSWADADIRAWHCISGVERLFLAMHGNGFRLVLIAEDIRAEDARSIP
jgi:hypothetical protein